MSLTIFADETKPAPRPVFVRLTCDGPHGFLPVEWLSSGGESYPQARARATREGWREVGGTRFLCPGCAA